MTLYGNPRPSKYDSRPSRDESWFDGRDNPHPLYPGFDFSGDLIETNISETLTPSILSQLRHDGPVLQDLMQTSTKRLLYPLMQRLIDDTSSPPCEGRYTYFETTTQYVPSMPSHRRIHDTQRSQYPAHKVNRGMNLLQQILSSKAWGGHTAAQLFAGKHSKYISAAGCSTEQNNLEN